ncbi:MAG: AMP-dependent synthetase/ligase, partial [Candidatus Rokuibacteriota bacterium]
MAASEHALDRERDTFPKLVRDNAARMPSRVAMREKDHGIWQPWTWRDYFEQARLIALGLASLGFSRGDKAAIVGDNRPPLYWAVTATQALGGIPVPLYQDSIEKELAYIVDHAEARFAIVEDQEQVDKLLHVREQCPRLQYIVYKDQRGMRAYAEPFLFSLEQLQEMGRKFARDNPDHFDAEVARGEAGDTAIICYTSGTTGVPKGTMLSHRNLILTARNAVAREGLRRDEEVLAYLPMAWVGDHIFSYAQSIIAGFTVNCPESGATVQHDLKEIGPTYFFAPPRIWENLLTSVLIRIEDAAWVKRRLVRFFLDLAQDTERRRLDRRAVPVWRRLLYPLGHVLVYGPLKDNLGMRRIRVAYTAGEAIGPEIFVFFRSLGINVKQLYGMTESSALIAIHEDGDVRLDTVGTPLPGVEIRISADGEVLYRSPGMFQGYYKNPEAT